MDIDLYDDDALVSRAQLIMSERGYHCDDDSDKMDEIILELAQREREVDCG